MLAPWPNFAHLVPVWGVVRFVPFFACCHYVRVCVSVNVWTLISTSLVALHFSCSDDWPWETMPGCPLVSYPVQRAPHFQGAFFAFFPNKGRMGCCWDKMFSFLLCFGRRVRWSPPWCCFRQRVYGRFVSCCVYTTPPHEVWPHFRQAWCDSSTPGRNTATTSLTHLPRLRCVGCSSSSSSRE